MKPKSKNKSVRKANAIKFFDELVEKFTGNGVPWTSSMRYRYNVVAKYLEES